MSHVAAVWFGKWWWLISIPVITPIALGLMLDPTWFFVALMVMCLCYPTIMLIVFCIHCVKPQARKASHDSVAEINQAGLRITYMPIDENTPVPSPTLIKYDEVSEYHVTRKGIALSWDNNPYNFIIIPHKSLSSAEEGRQFIEWLQNGIKK